MAGAVDRRLLLGGLAASTLAPRHADAEPAPVAWSDEPAFPNPPLANTYGVFFRAPAEPAVWPADLPLIGRDGPVNLDAWRGRTLLVALWAEWCAPCLAEMPSLSRLNRAYRNDRFEILPIVTGSTRLHSWREAHERLAALKDVDLPTLLDASRDGRRLMMRLAASPPPPGAPVAKPGMVVSTASLPCLLVVDPQGRLRGRFLGGPGGGENAWERATGEAFIKRLADGALAGPDSPRNGGTAL